MNAEGYFGFSPITLSHEEGKNMSQLAIMGEGPRIVKPETLQKIADGQNAKALGLGTVIRVWFGDDLPGIVGEIPAGYVTRPRFRQWIRGVHSPGHVAYGPYERIEGTGSFRVFWFIEATDRASAGDKAFSADVSDYDNGKTLVSGTFNVSMLPSGSDTFCVYSPELEIPKGRIESRVFAEGGASLKVWEIRWEINTI